MNKYKLLEKYMKENKDLWFTAKEINKVIPFHYYYLKMLADIGFLLIHTVKEPMRTNYFKYNPKSGSWCEVTKLIKEYKKNGN